MRSWRAGVKQCQVSELISILFGSHVSITVHSNNRPFLYFRVDVEFAADHNNSVEKVLRSQII